MNVSVPVCSRQLLELWSTRFGDCSMVFSSEATASIVLSRRSIGYGGMQPRPQTVGGNLFLPCNLFPSSVHALFIKANLPRALSIDPVPIYQSGRDVRAQSVRRCEKAPADLPRSFVHDLEIPFPFLLCLFLITAEERHVGRFRRSRDRL